MAAQKKDTAVDAGKMQSEQQKSDLKTAYLKAKAKALAENPDLPSTSIPEFTEGMDLKAAFERLSFVTGGQGSAKPGVRSRSSLDKIAPDAPESIMPGRPVVSNAQQLEKARAIGRKVSGKPLKGTVVSGSNAAFDSPEYAAAAQPGGLREQERDAELPAIQKAVFGSPQVGAAGSSNFKPASKDFQEATEVSEDPVTKHPIPGKSAKGTAQVGTAPSADFQAGVAAEGFYDTPYGRISAKKGRVGDVLTPTDTHRLNLKDQLEGMGRTYDPEAKYGSINNPTYRGAFEGSQKSEFNKKPDTMDAAERKRLGYTEKNDGTNFSYYGPSGDGPQNEVTNPTMDAYDKENQRLYKSNPSLFKEGTPQNKRFIADFLKNNPTYNQLKPIDKLKMRTEHMSKLGPHLLGDPEAYGETPPGVTLLEPPQPSEPIEPPAGASVLQPPRK